MFPESGPLPELVSLLHGSCGVAANLMFCPCYRYLLPLPVVVFADVSAGLEADKLCHC
jgi:hypothetical protein